MQSAQKAIYSKLSRAKNLTVHVKLAKGDRIWLVMVKILYFFASHPCRVHKSQIQRNQSLPEQQKLYEQSFVISYYYFRREQKYNVIFASEHCPVCN